MFGVSIDQERNQSEQITMELGFTGFQEKLEERPKEVPKETRCSIRSLAQSVAEDDKPENSEGNLNQPQDGARMETTSGIEWIYCRKTGKWDIIKDRNVEDISLPPSTPPSREDGSGGVGPSGGGGGPCRRGNEIWAGNSDEPPLSSFSNGNDPHPSSSSSNSSNDPS